MKRITALLLLLISLSAYPQDTPEYHRGVRVSTDVLALSMPVATIAYEFITQDWTGIKQGALTAATTIGATYILKYTTHKERPDGSDYHSFPSMHSATMFADAAFIQRRFGWKWGAPAYALAAYVGWGRTYAKKHDWWDVAAGAAIGAGSAYLFTRPFAKEHNLSVVPFTDGDHFLFSASMTF